METHDKIRAMREINQWTQEEMAEKLEMSANGYSKIERGVSSLNLEKLEQIANIFNIEASELLTSDKPFFCIVGDNNHSKNWQGTDEGLASENDKLHLIIEHKDELLAKQQDEITALKEIIALLKAK